MKSPVQSSGKRRIASVAAITVLALFGTLLAFAQQRKDEVRFDTRVETGDLDRELLVNHAECAFLAPDRERYLQTGLYAVTRRRYTSSQTTEDVTNKLGALRTLRAVPGGSRTRSFQELDKLATIDRRLFEAMQAEGVSPAERTNDFEFARRVSLDLTGRVPTVKALLGFTNSTNPNKRAELVDQLLDSEPWVDKWTMYFGDLFRNARLTAQINRYPEGRDAFYRWINESLAQNKPYNQIAKELISASGANSWQQGELNWMVGGLVMGSPRSGQDHYDQQAANIAETFLGMAHMDCVLCHDGRGHLDNLSLWGERAGRYEAWELASFLSRTVLQRHRVKVNNSNRNYYSVEDMKFRKPYPLNTTTGNRPERQPIGRIANVEPRYPFSGGTPADGETYRAALARELTKDLQFSRAAVNYIWKELFGLALVEPANQFDPARLDPDNPPPEPWTLQPNQPRLLNELAQEFMDNGYDLKALMRQMVTSEVYQLSSRYSGEWKPEYESLYARKFVRRLWGEEVHDAVAQTSKILPSYRLGDLGFISWAMKFPETARMPNNRSAVTAFLDSFLRGDRDQVSRSGDGTAVQAMQLMNSEYVIGRTRIIDYPGFQSLSGAAMHLPDKDAVELLFLTVLSRYPSELEMLHAMGRLSSGDRNEGVEDLQWALYNKVDFFFNY